MKMYSEWASLEQEIQCDTANQSVLHKFPAQVGRDVACAVVKPIAQNLSIAVSNSEQSNLNNTKDVRWVMEVLCFGLSLPLEEHESIRDCVNVYCEWLSALASPKPCVPKPVLEDPNPFAQVIVQHLLNLFVPRPKASIDLVRRQAVLCHRVLRTIQSVATESSILTRETWETLLKFLLAANDSLLSPPTEKDDIGDHLCERVLSVLLEMWLLCCARCFPSPSLWKTFRVMCINWRHHEALVLQWHRVNHVLTCRLLRFMYGPDYPELQLSEEDAQLLPGEITNDCVAQSWFRFLHILQNPVDLCHPEIISQTPKFLHMALASETVVDPSQHECLRKLPYIFYKAMRGISVMVNAFLGIAQCVKGENMLSPANNRSLTAPSSPPGQRKSKGAFAAVTAPLTQRVSRSTTSVNTSSATSKLPSVAPSSTPGQLSLEGREPLATTRPHCNSILHLFGAWLFEAALAGVKLHPCHVNKGSQGRRANSFTETRPSSITLDGLQERLKHADNTYEAGRAEACGALCRIFCAHKTGEEILTVYLSRFYIIMYYGLQTDEENISGQVLSNILFNSCDLLRVDLVGVQILVPYILSALELVLSDLNPKFKPHDQIPVIELRKACIHLLLSMLSLPLHFKDLEIKDIVGFPDELPISQSFISLKVRMIELLLKALLKETDSSNTQLLLGGLMLAMQDLALCEEADQTTLQPAHDVPVTVDSDSHMDSFHQESLHFRHSSQSSTTAKELDTAHGLFGQATSLVCNRLMASWKSDLNTALAAMEVLCGLAKVHLNFPNTLMCKRTVKWICDFIVYQCSRPAPNHSRDLHSMIVAAFKSLTLWLVEHNGLLQDKECLHNVLEVVELGISGSKSQPGTPLIACKNRVVNSDSKLYAHWQRKVGETQTVSLKLEKESKSAHMKNRASDPPKFKGDKQLMPASMRVKDAAEAVLTCIIDQVGAFPPPCGPESLFSLLDEKALLKCARGSTSEDQPSQFRYFVLDNSIIIGLLEQPLGNVEDPLPTVTALIRGPFGRHAWTMQLRHSPRLKKVSSKAHLSDPGRPLPMNNVGVHHNIKQRYFPEVVDKVALTKADLSIPTMKSLVTEKDAVELDKLTGFIQAQERFENKIKDRVHQKMRITHYPNRQTECKPPSICHEFQTARLFLSHYGFLSLEALKEPSNSSVPPALVMLDTTNTGLYADLETLDGVPTRDIDTVHIFYVKTGQTTSEKILRNVTRKSHVQPQFLEFVHSLGWPVDVKKHAGWTGHVSTSWKTLELEDLEDDECPSGTGGSVYNGQSKVLYWADVSTEVAFVIPSPESYLMKSSSSECNADKSPATARKTPAPEATLMKPRFLSLDMDKPPGPGPLLTDSASVRLRKTGRNFSQLTGPDTKVFVVWLESFEDYETFPAADLVGVTSTGLDQQGTSGGMVTYREKDLFILFIHALQNGLFRLQLQGHTTKMSMAIPLVSGMVVSRRSLGTLVRQTAINICRRKTLESELYQPPHVRRKLKIQEIVKKYRSNVTEPEFYTALFQDVSV
ncbi:ral GTPase-activating protein subunit beta-like isoform X2 [Liolophura sinensis]|uniref:ral GTPase-activating protein subunit beta-like isoform X2 n=1 Tax=Liolophura sinensis TaxID=3198878 RepID=UPI0031588C0E